MESNVFVGFNTSVENDVALRKIAAERRVDKTVVLNEAVSAYLAAQNAKSGTHEIALANNVRFAVDGVVTVEQAIAGCVATLRLALQDSRAALEAEWSGYNDRDTR